MKAVSIDLAAKIIRESISYAEQFGFRPHLDFHETATLLADADPDAAQEAVPHRLDGKPFFAAGPHDNVDRIMKQLTDKVGPAGFTYLGPLNAPDLIE